MKAPPFNRAGEVEIRYVIPLRPEGERVRFCHLRKGYFDSAALPMSIAIEVGVLGLVGPIRDVGDDGLAMGRIEPPSG